MGLIGDAVDAGKSTLDDAVTGGFDLAKENIDGMFTNMTLLTLLLASLTKDRPFPKTKLKAKDEYDYVIVGGGTAGSVMANRLSEVGCVSVLLLEAGDDAFFLSEIPSFARLFYGGPMDWNYKTTPQKYACFGQIENRTIWNSGKVLGGGSVLNAMLYVRGNMKNYDDWEREGATGWSNDDVFPYFLKLEDNKNINQEDAGYHAIRGPMTAMKPDYDPEIRQPIFDATAALGFEQRDPNGVRQTGIYDLQGTLRNGLRCSTAKAYLVPAEDRKNLDIVKNAFVTKVLIKDRRAIGVNFSQLGVSYTVKAKREVILSPGTVRTAQLLMLSGIGPRKHLEKFGIKVEADLPVGKNLQDHFSSNLVYKVKSTISPVVLKNLNPVNILEFTTNRSGPLASPNQVTVMAFLDGLNTTKNTVDFPRHELYFAEFATVDALKSYNLKPEVYSQVYGGYDLAPLYICFVSTLQPYSRGEVLLNSADPFDYPLINPNYYKDKRDVHDVVEGMKVCDAVAASPYMKKVGARPLGTLYPGCEKYKRNKDKYYACQTRQLVTTFWHPVGTARMGHREDPRSVVDPDLKVIGIERLRVVNAAVMPIIPSGNTNVPTMMVAEKASDIIKATIGCYQEERIPYRMKKRSRSPKKEDTSET